MKTGADKEGTDLDKMLPVETFVAAGRLCEQTRMLPESVFRMPFSPDRSEKAKLGYRYRIYLGRLKILLEESP